MKVSTRSCVYREYSRGLKTQPWGGPVLKRRVEEVCLPTFTTWGLPRKSRTYTHSEVFNPRSLSFVTKPGRKGSDKR